MDDDAPKPEAVKLGYAGTATPPVVADRYDGAVLVLGSLQLALATFLAINVLPERGRYELMEADWTQRLAWHGRDMTVVICSWTLLSLVAVVGGALPWRSRRRWYVGYALGVVAVMTALVAAAWVLYGNGIYIRWVPARGGPPQDWRYFSTDSVDLWQAPLMLLIVNPVLIVLAVRLARRLSG